MGFCDRRISGFEEDVFGIELFSGGGGLALGLEEAGIRNVVHVEKDEASCKTLRRNMPSWNILQKDVKDVCFLSYRGKVKVVSGGAPCQSFSHAGKREGLDDGRGALIWQFARCVRETEPVMFVLENVRGLVTHNKGATLRSICDLFSQLKYSVRYQVLDASRYGVGQKRERVFLIGIRSDVERKIDFHFPKSDDGVTTLRDALKGVSDAPFIPYNSRKYDVMSRVPPGGCWVDLPEEIAKAYMGKSYYSGGGRRGAARRLSWDKPSPTLPTCPTQKLTEPCHPDETRPLTVREYARLQTFPDTWEFVGSVRDQYKQIGNAVPVELARRVGIQIVKAINAYQRGK